MSRAESVCTWCDRELHSQTAGCMLCGREPVTNACGYCDGTGQIETDNNGPIVPCPVCQSARLAQGGGR